MDQTTTSKQELAKQLLLWVQDHWFGHGTTIEQGGHFGYRFERDDAVGGLVALRNF